MAFAVPPGNHLRVSISLIESINALLVTRDGTLWIGTFAGLATWSGGKLTRRPELGDEFVASLFEDRDGTVWAGTLETSGRLCALQKRRRAVLRGGWRLRQGRLGYV